MGRLAWAAVLMALAASSPSIAQTPPAGDTGASISTPTLKFGPPPAWVDRVDAPLATPAPSSGGALQPLLSDRQLYFGPNGDEYYVHTATRVIAASGLPALGAFAFAWDPDTSSVTLHRLAILRDGQTIDLLQGGKLLTVLRRETNLERAMLDGALTVTEPVPDLRVGDVLEIELTELHNDPALATSEGSIEMSPSPVETPTARWRGRILWPDAKKVRWLATDGMPSPTISHEHGLTELKLELADQTITGPPAGAPARFHYRDRLAATGFTQWEELSRRLSPLFDKAEALAPDSAVKSEIAKIMAAATTPEARASLALALVETQVRYQAINLNDGGYVPASADETWTRRYGDCKGKTVLLLALLQAMGIEAEPVLVSSALGDGLDQQAPEASLFDHVLVHARIGGADYWLDGTRPADAASLADLPSPPPYHWGLPLRREGAGLVAIVQRAAPDPLISVHEHIDASAGTGVPVPATLEIVDRGDGGLLHGFAAGALSHDRVLQALTAELARLLPGFEPQDIQWSYDAAKTVFTTRATGTVRLDWSSGASRPQTRLAANRVISLPGGETRAPGPDHDLPYATPFPFFTTFHEDVVLPAGGAGFDLQGGQVTRTLGPVTFSRQATLAAGVAHLDVSVQDAANEISAADAAALREFSEQLGGDPVLLLGPPAQPAVGAPTH